MKRFSLLLIPHNYKEFSKIYPMIKLIPPKFLFWFLEKLPPFKIGKLLAQSTEIEGSIILCPISHNQLGAMASKTNKKLLKAIKLAEKDGAKIIGLGTTNAYNNLPYRKINKSLNKNVITGEYFSAVNSLNLIKKTLREQMVDEDKCKFIVIGTLADNFSIFYLEIISSYYKEITLFGADKYHLPKILERIVYETGTIIKTTEELHKEIKDADVIIVTTEDTIQLNPTSLKSKAIVSLLVNNIEFKSQLAKRKDIKIIEGGEIEEIPELEFIGYGLNNKKVYPWVAETILNTLDNSLKTNLNTDRLSVRIAQKTYKAAVKYKLIT